MGYDFQRIQKLNEMYGKRLTECSLAGEIVLEENELLDLCNNLKQYSQYIHANRLNNVLLVVCANIAYYYYDESGFWSHFDDLCKLNRENFNNAIIGDKLERVLLYNNLIQYTRVGPFRYVGAILEQTGVTKYNIPIFSSATKELISKYGIKYLMNITYFRYTEIIENMYSSRFLKQYLLDEAGWNFYCYIIRTLFYLESGVLHVESIENFKGVHPLFWDEFLKYYSIRYRKQAKEKRTRLFYPRLMLDKIKCLIYMKFPHDSYTIRLKNTYINSDGNIIYYLRKKEYLQSRYLGELTTTDLEKYEWEITGWDPNKVNYAYFNEKGEYIDKIDNLNEGKCYIITNYIDDRPIGEVVKNIGSLNIPNLYGYEVYEIFINSLSTDKRYSRKVMLTWENNKGKLPINSYCDIFQEDIPSIRIRNIDLLESNEEVLLYDIGDGIKRIKDYYEFKELKIDMKSKCYFAGEIWSESIKRNRNDSNRNSLKFCVIPKCKLQLPVGEYGDTELIQFISDSSYISFKNSIRVEKDIWTVNESAINLEGNINFKDISLSFNYPINRVKLISNDNYQIRYCFIDDIYRDLLLNINTITDIKVDLFIYDGHRMICLINNCNIKQNGSFNFHVSDIKNWLNDSITDFAIGKLYLKNQNKYIDLSFGILNFNNLLENIEDVTNTNEQYCLLKSIDNNLAEKIIQVNNIYKNPTESINYILPDVYSPKLDELYKITLILSSIFDGLILKDRNGKIFEIDKINIENKEIVKTINWYYHTIEAIHEENQLIMKNLKEQYTELLIPKLPRWRDKINEVYNNLNCASDTTKIIKEWNEEVSKLKKYGLKSNIAKRENGTLITHAWIEYLKGNYPNSIQILGKIEKSTDVIIEELRTVLQIVIYFKLIRINAVMKKIEKYNGYIDEIKTIISAYSTACDIIFEKEISYKIDLLSVIDLFPFREDDKDFLVSFNILIKNKITNNLTEVNLFKNNNWMANFVYYKMLKNNLNNRIIIEERLKSQINEIPESPEKNQILNEILK